jgi:transposase-like protein
MLKLHANARTCPHSRRLVVDRVEVRGWTLTAAAEAAGVSVRTVSKWRRRYREEGEQGLADRCSAPASVPLRTDQARVAVIASLRRLRMTGAEIAERLAMPASTVSGSLTRIGLGSSGGWSRSSRRTGTRGSGRASSSTSRSRSSAGSAGPATASMATGVPGAAGSAGSTSTSRATTRPGSHTSRCSRTSKPRRRSASCVARSRTSPRSGSASSG